MVALLATVTGFANDANSLIKKGAKKTALVLENVKEGNLLSIKDSYGIILYKELIDTNGVYTKGFDLTELPDGDYVFELEKDLEVKTIPFTVKASTVSYKKSEEATYFKPYVKQENNMVYLTKLNLNQVPTSVKVFANIDGEYKLCHSEIVENEKVIEKVFRLGEGKYKIEINSNNKEYKTYINN